MAKLKDFSKELEKALRETTREIQSPSNMQKFGNELKDSIVKRTRLGYGARRNGGSREKLKPLSDSYKQQRKGKLGFWTGPDGIVRPITDKTYNASNTPKLSGLTSPGKSNLTRTGDMLDRIGVLAGVGKVMIGFRSGKQAIKAAFVSKMRPFFYATKPEITRTQRSIRRKLDEILKRKINF